MSWQWVIALVAPLLANLIQTWVQERIRRRQAPTAHERIAERVVVRLNGRDRELAARDSPPDGP